MSQMLTAILFGTWVTPESNRTWRHSCMKGVEKVEKRVLPENDAYIEAQVNILRFLREFKNRWFSPTEIHMNIKTKFSLSGMGVVLKDMVEEQFILVEYKTKNRRVAVYKFNGVEK